MKKFRIAKKIWLCLIILMIGYFISMAYGFIKGIQTENKLSEISTDLFPINILSQKALSLFNEQIKLYEDAVLTGDYFVIKKAQEKKVSLINYLNEIVQNSWLKSDKVNEINDFIESYSNFCKKAGEIYTILSSEDVSSLDSAVNKKASELAVETKDINKILSNYSDGFASELQAELLNISKTTRKQGIINLISFIIIALLSLLLTHLIIKRSISQPINHTLLMLKDIAQGEGDLTARIPVASYDEIGEMAVLFNQFIEKLQTMIKEITDDALLVNESSSSLTSMASQVSTGIAEMTKQSNNAEKGTNEMIDEINLIADTSNILNENFANISKTSGKMANKMNKVSKSASDFNAAIREIGKNSNSEYLISKKADEMVKDAIISMNLLEKAALEIGKVSGVIKKIAVQTNLLSLNASIEASTAQDAGKGFAVVATKIKHFASQTSHSAEDIVHRVSDVQNKTEKVITSINNISEIIEKIKDASSQIMNSVEYQKQSSNEMALNIADVKNGAVSIADSIADTSVKIDELTKKTFNNASRIEAFTSIIQAVKTTTNQSNENVGFVQKSAEDLSGVANRLQSLVSRFKV